MNYPKEVYGMSMFFPDLASRKEATEKICQNYQGKGTYLLRPSSSGDPSHLSLTLCESLSTIHNLKICIEQDANGVNSFYVAASFQFPSLEQLLDFYSQCEIDVKENIVDLKLLHPVTSHLLDIGVSQPNHWGEANVTKGSDDSDTPAKERNPVPVYLELESEQGQYLQTVPIVTSSTPLESISPPARDPTAPRSPQIKVKEKGKLGANSRLFTKVRSKSVNVTSAPIIGRKLRSFSQVEELEKIPSNLDEKQPHCRPPAPLPPQNIPESDDMIYSYVDVEHDFFEETYKFLKETETCECGLRLIDAELPCGWAVHYSKEEATRDFVFFQRGDVTTWDIPKEILPLLSMNQEKFIVALCRQKPCPIPPSLTQSIESKFSKYKLSSSPKRLSPVRKVNSSPAVSTMSVSSTASKGRSKQPKHGTQRKHSLQVNAEKYDGGYYEVAEELFASKASDVPATPRQAGQRKASQEEKPQPLVRRSIPTQSSFQDLYVLEDADLPPLQQAGSNSDECQDDQRGSRTLSATPSPMSSDRKRSASKQVKFEIPVIGPVPQELFEEHRSYEGLSRSMGTMSLGENDSPVGATLQHQQGHLEVGTTVMSPQSRSMEHRQHIQSKPQQSPVRPPRRSSAKPTYIENSPVSDWQAVAQQQQRQYQQTDQLQQQQLPLHAQPARVTSDSSRLQLLVGQGQMSEEGQRYMSVQDGPIVLHESDQKFYLVQGSMPFQVQGQLSNPSNHPVLMQQLSSSTEERQSFYFVRDKPK